MNLNKIFLIGRLTQDPESRSTAGGQNVTTLRMATNRVWTNQSGQKQDATEYHTVVAWGRLAEIAGRYLRKGGLVMIEGRMQPRNWTGQDNIKRYSTEIVAESLQLGPRPQGQGLPGQGTGEGPASESRSSAPATPEPEIPIIDENEPLQSGVEEGEMKIKEEDLPF